MKDPFPAYFFDTYPAPFESVRVRPCTVLQVNTQSGTALIALGSLVAAGRVEKWVSIFDLASTAELAAAKFAQLLPALAEKSASLEKAGAAAGTPCR